MNPLPSQQEKDAYEQLVTQGMLAARLGDRNTARRHLAKAAEMGCGDARPWLWLSATTDDQAEKRKYLEFAVAAEPGNAAARRGLVFLSGKLDGEKIVPEGGQVEPCGPQEPEEAQAKAHRCPKCGGSFAYDVRIEGLKCQHCGFLQSSGIRMVGGEVERPVDFILLTVRGHRWAESQERVSCEQCGAIAVLPPGQTADRCDYCGSHRLVRCPEAGDLIDPQAIALLKLDATEAARRVKEWLRKGWLTPDDLLSGSKDSYLRPAYYPFWAFDGTLELSWRCEVKQGSGDRSDWVWKSGTEFVFFDDVLAPGMRALDDKMIAGIEPFDTKKMVAFEPDYLVGWRAFTYDRSMSDAMLLAREKVVKGLKSKLFARVEPGKQKRNLDTGAGKWSGQTYKLLLLPLWVGSYSYRGKSYRLLVNGQTGRVAGEKPRDGLKAAMIATGAAALLLILGILLYWFITTNGVSSLFS